MAHQRPDRLWKFEDSWTKLEIYAVDYAYHPKVDQLRCDVLVKAKHFSGEYQTVIAWQDAMSFGNACETLATAMAASLKSSPVAFRDFIDRPYLSIGVAAEGVRKVRWDVECCPAGCLIEVLSLQVTTEYQLLNSINAGIEQVWKKWPGPNALAPGGARQRRTKRAT